jgi:inosine-uridine nucleoside N-ribohydrolase
MAQKIVVDTDPGVDDVLAILMALASPELDVALISIVFGNTHAPVAHANLLKIYHLLAQELAEIPDAEARYARLAQPNKTVLALGEDRPIGGEKAVAAYFVSVLGLSNPCSMTEGERLLNVQHGMDGLSNISETHPHFTPPELEPGATHQHLEISQKSSYEAILDLLRDEPEHTVTIVALGPCTSYGAMRNPRSEQH